MRENNVLARPVCSFAVIVAISGCAGPAAYNQAVPAREVAARPAAVTVQAGGPTAKAHYGLANLRLDAAYQRLSTHMGLAGQLALSSQQTVWLNARAQQCALGGSVDYVCATQATASRTAFFDAQKLPVPGKVVVPAPPLAAAKPVLASKIPVPLVASPLAARVSKPAATLHSYAVAATAMPWIWRPGGINQQFSFGFPNGTEPTVVPLAAAGDDVVIAYTGGKIRIGAEGPSADGAGYAGLLADGKKGPLGAFPSTYMQNYPINLGALVGVFTDAQGKIVDAPFAIGNGSVRRPVPAGATRLQLGINNDVFGGVTADTKNSGGFMVSVGVVAADGAP